MARLPNFLVIIRSEKLSGKGQGRGVGVRKKERFVLGKRTFRSQKSKHFVLRIINQSVDSIVSSLNKIIARWEKGVLADCASKKLYEKVSPEAVVKLYKTLI